MRNERGFTLIELMVVVMIIAILVFFGLPTYLKIRSNANDGLIKANLTSVAKAEAGQNVVQGAYSDDLVVMGQVIPEVELGNANDASVRIVVGDVNPGDSNQVLLYARSASGTWFGIKLVAIGAGSGRYTCSGNAEADMTLAGCSGVSW